MQLREKWSFCAPKRYESCITNQGDHMGTALFEPLCRKTPISLAKTHWRPCPAVGTTGHSYVQVPKAKQSDGL